jgi:hypothetical protein
MAAPDVNLRTGNINTSAVVAAKIGALAVTTAKINTKAVTGVKLDEAAFLHKVFTGRNGAGVVVLAGAKVGDVVISMLNVTDITDDVGSFETTITVANQIQQVDAANLSAKKFSVMLVVKS